MIGRGADHHNLLRPAPHPVPHLRTAEGIRFRLAQRRLIVRLPQRRPDRPSRRARLQLIAGTAVLLDERDPASGTASPCENLAHAARQAFPIVEGELPVNIPI